MKLKQSSFILALVLATAGPAFADHIATGSKIADGGFISTEASTQQSHFQNTSVISDSEMRVFKEGKGGATGNTSVQFCSFNEKSDTGMPLVVATDSDDHKESLADFDLKYDKSSGSHHDKDWDDRTASAVAVPEPGSQLLLLVGLAALGMSLYLRHLLKIAI